MVEKYSIVWYICVTHTHRYTHTHTHTHKYIHSSIDGHLDYFHTLTIINNAAINIGVHISLWINVVCVCLCVCVCAQLLQLCLTLCDSTDCSPPGPSVHGILQARILEWVAMFSSRGSCQPRDQTHILCISCSASRFFTHWGHLGSPWISVFFR